MSHGLLHKLQSAPERSKQKWLVGLSVLFIGLVVIVWLRLVGSIFPKAEVADAGSQATGFSPGDSFRQGAAAFYQSALDGLKGLFNHFAEPKEIQVEPPQS